jgi:hypothetical protein
MKTGTTQADKLNNVVAELRRAAHLEGIETLLILATKHRTDGPPHRYVSVGSIEGCNRCAMESLGRLIGMGMSEMMIADHLDAIQTAYAERIGHTPSAQIGCEARELVLS